MYGKDRNLADFSPSCFQADAKIAFEFPLLRQRFQRFQIVGPNVFARLEFNRRVIAQNKVYFKARL